MVNSLNIKLKNNPLIYRDILTIPQNVNFGLELELDKINPDYVYKLVKEEFGSKWLVKTDRSLTKNENAEIVTPILHNSKQTWILLKKMGELLEKINPTYDICSFQVNFDGSMLPTEEDRVRFLKLYSMYEDIIYRFSKGEDEDYRDTIEIYASPIILLLKGIKQYDNTYILELFTNNKRHGISFKNIPKDLIEFRTPNMTSNPILWQNYITFFYYLLDYVKNNKINMKEIDEYIDNFYKMFILEYYSLEKKDKAIELTKKIFSKNIDKIHFMHQYLGNKK